MKDMESKTRQILRKNEKCGITTREITREELPLFKDIMQHTSDRREFVDRPLSYYEEMWDNLHDTGILRILIAEIDFNEYEKNTKDELNQNKNELEDRINKKENGANMKKISKIFCNKKSRSFTKRLQNIPFS